MFVVKPLPKWLKLRLTLLSVNKNMKQWELSYIAGGSLKLYDNFGNRLALSDKFKYSLTLWPSNNIPRCLSREMNVYVRKKTIP